MLGLLFAWIFADPITVGGSEKPYQIFLQSAVDMQLESVPRVVKEDLDQSLKFVVHLDRRPENIDYVVELQISRPNSPDQCMIHLKIMNRDGKAMFKTDVPYRIRQPATKPESFRRLAHKVADLIFENIHAVHGHFHSQIVYVEATTHYSHKNKVRGTRLVLADYDGHNKQELTESDHRILLPEFSPCGQYLLYRILNEQGIQTAYMMHIPRREIVDLSRHMHKVFGKDVLGHNISSLRFGRHKDEILFAPSRQGTTNIYAYNKQTNDLYALTNARSAYIQTCPCYSPDGTLLAFSSDVSGDETVYVLFNGTDAVNLPLPAQRRFSQPQWIQCATGKMAKTKTRLYFSGRGQGTSSIWYLDHDPLEPARLDRVRCVTEIRSPSFIEKPSPAPGGLYVAYLHACLGMREVVMLDDKGNEIMTFDSTTGEPRPILSCLGQNVLDLTWSSAVTLY